MKSLLLIFTLLAATNSALANTPIFNRISGVFVTDLLVYETDDNAVDVLVYLNGQERPGLNPRYLHNTCEIRTYNSTVYSLLLEAYKKGKRVDIDYVDNSNRNHLCKTYAVRFSD